MSSLTGTPSKNVLLEKKSQPDPDLKPPQNKWEGGDGGPAWRALVWPSLPGACSFCPQISSSASAWKATCRLGENERALEPNKTGFISHFHH